MANYKLCFFVPEDAAETVKEAIFATGAGGIGNYRRCAWQTLGQGQFEPLDGANPAIGAIGGLERVPEYKVEILCTEAQLRPAVAAMKNAHPYEEVAYEVYGLVEV